MIKYIFYLAVLIIFGCKSNSDSGKKTQENNLEKFTEDFINIKKNDYDFNKIKYVNYGDSLAYKYWIEESGIDKEYLRKYFKTNKKDLENSIVKNRPVLLEKYRLFDFKDFNNYMANNPNSSFNEYFSINFSKCELLSINFLVFNETGDRVLICHSLDCTHAYIEVYSKKDGTWFLLKTISQVT